MESLKHKSAKKRLVSWLREVMVETPGCYPPFVWTPPKRAPYNMEDRYPHFGIREEYPIATNGCDILGTRPVWDRVSAESPTYEWCIAQGHLPVCIFDIAIESGSWNPLYFPEESWIAIGIEIVHTNPVSPKKAAYFPRIRVESVYEVDADWILAQPERPEYGLCPVGKSAPHAREIYNISRDHPNVEDLREEVRARVAARKAELAAA